MIKLIKARQLRFYKINLIFIKKNWMRLISKVSKKLRFCKMKIWGSPGYLIFKKNNHLNLIIYR